MEKTENIRLTETLAKEKDKIAKDLQKRVEELLRANGQLQGRFEGIEGDRGRLEKELAEGKGQLRELEKEIIDMRVKFNE